MNPLSGAALRVLAMLAAVGGDVPSPMMSGSYRRRRGNPSSGWLKALSHTQMAKAVKHPGQRKTKKRRRANLAMTAFPKATR